jgi:hypothetical protein
MGNYDIDFAQILISSSHRIFLKNALMRKEIGIRSVAGRFDILFSVFRETGINYISSKILSGFSEQKKEILSKDSLLRNCLIAETQGYLNYSTIRQTLIDSDDRGLIQFEALLKVYVERVEEFWKYPEIMSCYEYPFAYIWSELSKPGPFNVTKILPCVSMPNESVPGAKIEEAARNVLTEVWKIPQNIQNIIQKLSKTFIIVKANSPALVSVGAHDIAHYVHLLGHRLLYYSSIQYRGFLTYADIDKLIQLFALFIRIFQSVNEHGGIRTVDGPSLKFANDCHEFLLVTIALKGTVKIFMEGPWVKITKSTMKEMASAIECGNPFTPIDTFHTSISNIAKDRKKPPQPFAH